MGNKEWRGKFKQGTGNKVDSLVMRSIVGETGGE